MPVKRTYIVLATLPVALYLLLLVLVAALYVKPPLLGWIGFAVVAVVATGLAIGAVYLFPRMGVNAGAVRAGGTASGMLVLADAGCSAQVLCDSVATHLHGRALEVHVVAPVLASPLHYLSGDERREQAQAQERLDETLGALERNGIRATGTLGADDPVQALGDALDAFPAREVVLVTPRSSHWLEYDLLERAHRLAPEAEQLVV